MNLQDFNLSLQIYDNTCKALNRVVIEVAIEVIVIIDIKIESSAKRKSTFKFGHCCQHFKYKGNNL